MIHVDFNNVKDGINESVGQEPGNHSISNGRNSTRYLKFIRFFVNNRSDHFKQITNIMEIIKINVNETRANNTVSTTLR